MNISIVINVGDKRRQMNHFGDGVGGNDHTLLIRGDMLFIYTVDAPIAIDCIPY